MTSLVLLEQQLKNLQQQRALLDEPTLASGEPPSLKELEAQLASLQEKRSRLDPPSLLTEAPTALGQGALSGALKTGMGLAQSDPMGQEMKMWMSTQDDLAPYVETHDALLKEGEQKLLRDEEETLQTLHSPFSRMAYHAGDWMGNSAVMPGASGVKAGLKLPSFLAQFAKNKAKTVAKDGTLGTVSGFLQEGNVNPFVADILASLSPAAVKGFKNAGQMLFSPEYQQKKAQEGAQQNVGKILREEMTGQPEKPLSWSYRMGHEGAEMMDALKQGTKQFVKSPLDWLNGPVKEKHPPTSLAAHNVLALAQDMNLDHFAHDINVGSHVDPIKEHQVLPHQAGSDVRGFLLKKLEDLYQKRSQETAPLYEELMSITEGLEPAQARAVIEHKLKTAKGDVRTHLERAEKELQPNDPKPLGQKTLTPQQQEELSALKSHLAQTESHRDYNPKNPSPTVVSVRKRVHDLEGAPSSPRQPLPAELDNTLKWLGDEISSARKQGKDGLARELMQVKESIEESLEGLSQGTAYRQKYNALSKPINALEEHRTLGKIVGEKKNTYSKQYVLSDSEIPQKVIGTSLKSVDDARDLMGHLRGKKGQQARASLEGTINKSVLDFITDEHGKVSTSKIHTWVKNHPGAFILSPGLQTRLKSLANAQHFADRIVSQAQNLSPLQAYHRLPIHALKKHLSKYPFMNKVTGYFERILESSGTKAQQEMLNQALTDPAMAVMMMTPMKDLGKLEKAISAAQKAGQIVLRN